MKNQNQLNGKFLLLQEREPLISLPLLHWLLNYCISNATHGGEALFW